MKRFFGKKKKDNTEISLIPKKNEPKVKPVPLPLYSDNHIHYYIFLYGKEYGKWLENWRAESRRSNLRRRISVDSPECSSSLTSHPESSQEILTCSSQQKSRSSVQSPLLNVNKKLSVTSTTSAETNKTGDSELKPALRKTSSPKRNDNIRKQPKNESGKENIVNIQKNSLGNQNLKKRVISFEEEQPHTSNTEPSTSVPKPQTFDSYDSIDRRDQASTSRSQPEEEKTKLKKSASFESLSSVSCKSELIDTPIECYIYEKTTKPHQDKEHGVNTELQYALSQSIPVSSETLYDGTLSEDNDTYPQRQRSASVNLDKTPPSPAPATPLAHKNIYWQRRAHSCERVETQLKTDDYEFWLKHKQENETTFTAGPRHVYLKVPYGKKYSLHYETLKQNRQKENPTVELKRYREQSSSTQRAFAERIYDQFHSNRRNLTKENNRSSMGKMNSMDDHERKIIIEFCHLLEKSKQLFNGLRELPQYGHKNWSSYFGRTFDIYTRLWKYQQQHRAILDSKYGMKRWQIGEIASKIGQLYYHFYLRTSDTNYLNEAYSFYHAIRGRCYYTKANKEDKCELMVKKLRYYARFIVVCLLLKKMKLVKELIKELDRQIIEYGNTYDPDDQVEWTVVVDEVKAFIHAEPAVAIIDHDNYTVIVSNRLTPMTTPAVERTPQMNLTLQEILIVGSSSHQVKFSELTIDMFRMLQTLEREPTGEVQHNFDESPRARYTSTPNAHSQDLEQHPEHFVVLDGIEPKMKMPNPHKYLLFKPTTSQILVYLASGCNDLPPNGVLLLYISADGHMPQPPKHAEDVGYDMGGLITTSKNDIHRECNRDQKTPGSSKVKELQCLYPGDLNPFTRRPFILIVDSDNSYAFQNIPRHFGQPMVILMSPLELPTSFHDRRQQGSLFTLFLHSPLTAFCYCCDISNISLANWDRAQILIETFVAEASTIIMRSRIDVSYIIFLGDDFLRLLILRYIFCEVVLRMHRGFRARTHLPRCVPALPDDLFEHPTFVHIVMDLASHLQVRSHFHDPNIASGPPTTKD